MEGEAYLIGAALMLVSTGLIYLIASVTMREKSYDDILEEQKRRREEVLGSPQDKLVEKKPPKKKPPKKKPLRADRSSNVTDGEERDSQTEAPVKMVEIELDTDIIDEAPKKEQKQKGKKQKPILLNKSEKSSVRDSLATETLYHKQVPPKDSLELKHERERRLSASKPDSPVAAEKPKKKKEVKAEVAPPTVQSTHQEQIHMTTAPEVQTTSQPREKRTKKRDAAGILRSDAEPASSDGGHLLATVQAAHLTDTDIQTLVEALLRKQTGGSTQLQDTATHWKTKHQKGDPVTLLEKQLEEKNQAFKDEQEACRAAGRRIKDLQVEVVQEKHQYSELEKTSQDKLAAHVDDIQALQLRMQQTHEQHAVEVNTLQRQLEQHRKGALGDGGQAALLQQIKEENRQLQEKAGTTHQQLKIVQEELNKQIQESGTKESTRSIMEAKVHQLEDKVKKAEGAQKDTENCLTQKYSEVIKQFQREQAKSETMVREMEKVKGDRHQREQDLANVRNRMKDLEGHKSMREQELARLQEKLQAFQEENTSLMTELQTMRERTAGEGQEAPCKPPGQVAPMMSESVKTEEVVQRSIYEQTLSQKDAEMSMVRSELENQKSLELTLLRTELDNQRKAELIQLKTDLENQKLAELSALQTTLESQKQVELSGLRTDLDSQKQVELSTLQTNLESQKATEASQLGSDLQGQLNNLQQDLDKQRQKNNELEKERDRVESGARAAANHDAEVGSRRIQELSQQLTEKSLELQCAHTDLESSRRDTEELREKNWKAMEALSEAEKSVEEKVGLAEELTQVKDSLQKLFPDVEIKQSAVNTWVINVEQQISQHRQVAPPSDGQAGEADHSEELSMTQEANVRLEGQVQHYKSVLSNTESMLNRLQNSVESEEQKWSKKVGLSEEELKKAQTDNGRLQEEIGRLKTTPETVANGSSVSEELLETRQQLAATQKDLEKEVQANQQLTQKLAASVESESSSV